MATRVVMSPDWHQQVQHEADGFVEHELNPIIADDMRRRCPVKTGRLLATVDVQGKQIHAGSTSASYVLDVEFGTRAHDIEPRSKQALSWPDGDHPVKRVHHPAVPANPFMRSALYQRRG